MLVLNLAACGSISIDSEGVPYWSPTMIPGGMPVFSPPVVIPALENAYTEGLQVALQYHTAKAEEYLKVKQYHLAKIHADCVDGIIEASDARKA